MGGNGNTRNPYYVNYVNTTVNMQNSKSRSMVMLQKDFSIKTGLRRRDALPSVLFSIALESVVTGRCDTDVGISVQNNINSMCRPFGVYRQNRGGSQDSSRITNKEKQTHGINGKKKNYMILYPMTDGSLATYGKIFERINRLPTRLSPNNSPLRARRDVVHALNVIPSRLLYRSSTQK